MPDDNSINKSLAEEIYKKNVELLEQRRRAVQLLYSVSESVTAVDTDLKITIFNRAAEKMLGIEVDAAIGKSADDLIKIETEKGEPISAKSYSFQEDPKKNNIEIAILKTPVRNYYVNVKTSIIDQVGGQKECLITIADVTKQVELDKTKDDFISVTSHELRTPITIIKSYLWMLQSEKGGPLTQKQKEYLEKATKGAERLLALINDTLNISRIENGKIEFKLENIDLTAFIAEVIPDFKIKTDEKNIKLNIELANDLKIVRSDKDKLREIFTNLFGNAFKFTQNGSITIRAENTPSDKVKVSVVDSGRGLSQDDLKRLFHKFGRLDNSYQTVAESAGTGLGLFIVKNLIEAMGGTIGAESEGEGKGSTFWFTLPAVHIEKIESLEIIPRNATAITTIA